MANQQINYRSELVKMLKYLRKIKPRYYELKRRTFKSTYLCSNGQDAEAIYLSDDLTVTELKDFIKDIPDHLTLDAFKEEDHDDVVLMFKYVCKQDDPGYYRTIKQWYDYELAKEKVKDIPIPTEEEYHEMLAKIKRYADAKVNYVSC